MQKVEKRQKRRRCKQKKKKKACIIQSDFVCLMRIRIINHVKTTRKRGRWIKVCIIIISNVRARGANVNDVIVLSQPPRPH